MTIAKPGNPHGAPRETLYKVSFLLDMETLGMLRDIETENGASTSTAMRHIIRYKHALVTGSPLPAFEFFSSASKTYFIQRGDDGPIKIGHSVNPGQRLTQLQPAVAEPLRLLAVTEGGHVTEHDLHVRFADTRLEGEWFSPSADLLAYIAGLR